MMGNNDKLIVERTEARAEAFRAQEEARSAWSQLSYVAEALGVAQYGGCYSPNDVLSAAKAAQERVRKLTEQTDILSAQNRRLQNNFATAVERGEELAERVRELEELVYRHLYQYAAETRDNLIREAEQIATKRREGK